MGMKVKALEWSEAQEPNKECSYNHMRASTEIGTYSIEWKGWKEYDDFVVYFNDQFIVSVDRGLDGSKAAAQEDFNRRILSSIEQD